MPHLHKYKDKTYFELDIVLLQASSPYLLPQFLFIIGLESSPGKLLYASLVLLVGPVVAIRHSSMGLKWQKSINLAAESGPVSTDLSMISLRHNTLWLATDLPSGITSINIGQDQLTYRALTWAESEVLTRNILALAQKEFWSDPAHWERGFYQDNAPAKQPDAAQQEDFLDRMAGW